MKIMRMLELSKLIEREGNEIPGIYIWSYMQDLHGKLYTNNEIYVLRLNSELDEFEKENMIKKHIVNYAFEHTREFIFSFDDEFCGSDAKFMIDNRIWIVVKNFYSEDLCGIQMEYIEEDLKNELIKKGFSEN